MNARYNPHKFQKIIKSLLPTVSTLDLLEDIKTRLLQLWSDSQINQFYPSCNFETIPKDYIAEYGIDVCRLYLLTVANCSSIDDKLFESNYKWLSALLSHFTSPEIRPFDEKIWLKAIYEVNDYALVMGKYNLALSKIKSAFKLSPPNIDLSTKNKILILSAIYPFAPVISSYLLHIGTLCEIKKINLKKILVEEFDEYKILKFAIQKSGWHFAVLKKQDFESNIKMAFRSIVGFDKMTNGKDFEVRKEHGNYKICLTI